MRISCIVIVPNKIMSAVLFPANNFNDKLPSENEIPHITLMAGEWKPFQSNDILKVLFNGRNGIKKDLYEEMRNAKVEKVLVEKLNVQVGRNKQSEDVYIVRADDLLVSGTMARFEN